MTSVVLERIFDGLIIATLLWVLMLFIPPDAPDINRIRAGATGMFVVFGGGFLFLLLARWRHDFVVSMMRKTAGRVAPGPTEKIIGIVDNFVGALKQLPDPKNFSLFFVWTAAYWFLNGVGMTYFANGFDCSGAAPGSECFPLHLTLFQGFFVLCVMIVGMLIPAAPGSAASAGSSSAPSPGSTTTSDYSSATTAATTSTKHSSHSPAASSASEDSRRHSETSS